MSTKIYNGYRITGIGNDLGKLASLMRDFGVRARALIEAEVAKLIAELAVGRIDAAVLQKPDGWSDEEARGNDHPLSAASCYIQHRAEEIRATQRRNPTYDFECSVCLLPHSGDVYAMLFTERDSLQSLWESVAGVELCQYWDNTDPPSGITWEQWESRGQLWSAILSDGIPSHSGFTFEAHDRFLPLPDREAVLQAVPDFESRAKHWARQAAVDGWLAARRAELPATPTERDALNLFWDSLGWAKSADGLAAIAAQAEVIKSKLKPVLTVEDLITPAPYVTEGK